MSVFVTCFWVAWLGASVFMALSFLLPDVPRDRRFMATIWLVTAIGASVQAAAR